MKFGPPNLRICSNIMRVNLAIIERSPGWTVLKEDIYKAWVYWFEKAGCLVSLTYNQILYGCSNIIFGAYYLEPRQIDTILSSGLSYGLFETEIVSSTGHNHDTEIKRLESHKRLYSSARLILTAVPQNVTALAHMGFLARYIPIGYCSWLETLKPLPDAYQDVDLFFFGNIDKRRARVIKALEEESFSVTVLDHSLPIPHLIRNGWVSRSKIVLSLRRGPPYTHLGVSRIWHLAHNRVMTLSEPPGEDDQSADGLCEFRPFEEFSATIKHYLANPDERVARGEEFYRNLRKIKTEDHLREAIGFYR